MCALIEASFPFLSFGGTQAAYVAETMSWDAVFLHLAGCYTLAALVFWKWGTATQLNG